MNFLNPLAFAWAFLIPLIVLLYFLKLKRREIPISSTYLWKKSVMDMRVNAPFQRLRKNLLLFLQILILIAAILALSQPFLDVRGFERQSLIVLIDRSASMGAASGLESRLDQAKRTAEEIVNDLSTGDEMAVIAFSSSSQVLSPFSRSKSALRSAIRKISPGESGTDVSEALEVARAIARLRQNPEVILISDRRFPDGSKAGLERAGFRYLKVGEPAANLGITALDLRRGLDMGGDAEAYVRVHNFSDEAREATLVLKLNGREFDAREIDIPAGGSISQLFSGLGIQEVEEQVLEVSIDQEGADALSADDRAYAILERPEPLRVILATERGYFLERDLTLDPDVLFRKISTAEVDPQGIFVFADDRTPDVTILDQVVPDTLPPGSYLIIGPAPPVEGYEMSGAVEDPILLDWNAAHPAMRFVNLENLRIRKAGKISFPQGTEVLAESDEGPLILAYESQGVRLLHINFNIWESDWPIRLSFPVFISNAIRWLGGREQMELGRQLETGGVIPIRRVAEGKVVIRTPSGESVSLETSGESQRFFSRTESVGLFTVVYPDGREEKFAVNLLDPDESNLTPPDRGALTEREEEATGSIRTNREVWWPLVLGAFLILLLEWYIYNRRVHL